MQLFFQMSKLGLVPLRVHALAVRDRLANDFPDIFAPGKLFHPTLANGDGWSLREYRNEPDTREGTSRVPDLVDACALLSDSEQSDPEEATPIGGINLNEERTKDKSPVVY